MGLFIRHASCSLSDRFVNWKPITQKWKFCHNLLTLILPNIWLSSVENGLVTNILQNIFFCILQKKVSECWQNFHFPTRLDLLGFVEDFMHQICIFWHDVQSKNWLEPDTIQAFIWRMHCFFPSLSFLYWKSKCPSLLSVSLLISLCNHLL